MSIQLQPRDFSASLAFGQEGEHLIAEALLRRGCAVSPLYQFQTHDAAPVMLWRQNGELAKCILPDLTVWSSTREVLFVEVKRKTRWVTYEAHKETGFNQRHFDHYLELRQRLGTPIWVFFLHEQREPTGVYVGEISALEKSIRRWDGMIVGTPYRASVPLALFPIHTLRRWCSLEEVGISGDTPDLGRG